MNNYTDFSNYSDNEILNMLREKQREYIILIQSEIIAKKLLSFYDKKLFTGNYHSRINNEYYLLYERATKKKIISSQDNINNNINIPIFSISCRLEESKNEFLNNNEEDPEYKSICEEIINTLNDKIDNVVIEYINGELFFNENGEYLLLNDETVDKLLDTPKTKILQK